MEVVRGLHNIKDAHYGSVITIGNFDGVHLGHQAIINQLKAKADDLNLPCTVLTFEPHPEEFFSRAHYGTRLTPFREKLELLAEYGVDRLVCARFNQKFADLTAGEFVCDVLIKGLGSKHIVIGDDFRFGKGREGDFEFLVAKGAQHDFEVENTPTFIVDEERVSSTRIREALSLCKLSLAERLLGHPYFITGVVQHGDKRGRTIGFPTANIRLKQQIAPPNGVYAVKISGLDREYSGVANIGQRPTVDDSKYLLEVHLFDFNQDIYRKKLKVHLVEHIRPEQKFANLDELTARIKEDSKIAKTILST